MLSLDATDCEGVTVASVANALAQAPTGAGAFARLVATGQRDALAIRAALAPTVARLSTASGRPLTAANAQEVILRDNALPGARLPPRPVSPAKRAGGGAGAGLPTALTSHFQTSEKRAADAAAAEAAAAAKKDDDDAFSVALQRPLIARRPFTGAQRTAPAPAHPTHTQH